ncbi:MAG: M28 family peptidase [Lentisphaeria bacterium]|nr:M28 family peptidase [Lentisphaeria bacterium]
MFEEEKVLLKHLCQKTDAARQAALEEVLQSKGKSYENWDDMALVLPSSAEKTVVLCAHFDAVSGSCGYNDNGMALLVMLFLMGKLPSCVEFVFTNGEERGALGASHYLRRVKKRIGGCVNLDVVGCFDQVYLDPMNCPAARSLRNCKQGFMPMSDAHAFAARGIESVCFSSGPSFVPFREGIGKIFSTIHNNMNDNDFSLLNFAMIEKVSAEAEKAVFLMAA